MPRIRDRARSRVRPAQPLVVRLVDAASLLGLSASATRLLIRAGKLKALRVGRRTIVIRMTELNRFLEEAEEVSHAKSA